MDKLSKIRKDREDRFFERRIRCAAHDKKEMIKSDLIKHEQLIADPKIREKIDKLREDREEKRELKEEERNCKNLNVCLNAETMAIDKEDTTKKNPRKILNIRKQMKLKQKEKLIANRKIFEKKINIIIKA